MFAKRKTQFVVLGTGKARATGYCDDFAVSGYVNRASGRRIRNRGRPTRTGYRINRNGRRRAGRDTFVRPQPEPGARRSLAHLAPSAATTQESRKLKRQGDAIAGRQLREIQRPKRQVDTDARATAARVDVDKCTGCGRCLTVCPVGAITLEGDVAVVNETICTACALCAAECPKDAISLRR